MRAFLLRATCLAALACIGTQPAFAQDSIDISASLDTRDAKIESGEFFDEFWIDGQAGDLLDVRVTSDDFDTYLIVSGPGEAEFENDDASSSTVNSRILERLPASGSYRVVVTSYEPGEQGAYSLQASTRAGGSNDGLSSRVDGDLGIGDDRLTSGEFSDNYSFNAEVGDLVDIRLTSSEFDTYVMLRGPGDTNLENDDAEPGDTNSQISATLSQSGEYTVVVTSYAAEETGSYMLDVTGAEVTAMPSRAPRARFGGVSSSARLEVGSDFAGSLSRSDNLLDSGEYFDVYTLDADPGAQLILRMRSDEIDTYLAAFGSDGFEAANDDTTQSGGSTNSRIEVVVPISGTLTVAATSYSGGETGSYTLSAEPSAGGQVDISMSEPIALGDRVDGILDASGQRDGGGFEDSYVLQGQAQQEVELLLSSNDFDTILRIEGPGGFRIENDDDPRFRTLDSRITATLPETGTYRLVVSSFEEGARGDYRLETGTSAGGTQSPLAATQALSLGEKVTGTLAAGDESFGTGEFADFYQFEGVRGQRLNFEMESEEFDTFLSLNFPGGGQETNDDRAGMEDTNSRLSITLPEDGTYRLAATSYASGEEGTYSLSMEIADASVRTVAPTSSGSRVFALSVGVADYERIETLDLTDRDALKLSQTLSAAGVLAPESVTLLNSDATRENFEAAFNSIAAEIGPDDLFLVFFSGHGDKIEGVTTEMDGSSETIELFDAALHDHELADMFANIDARTLLVIDACFSGGFDNVIDQRIDRMGIFSSDADVLSLVAQKYESGGYVSLLLRQALEGDADTNGDMAITAGELSEFMRREFYRIALDAPLDAGGEDFRGEETLGYQHLIVDRGGDGMPYGQVLMNMSGGRSAEARGPAIPALSLAD